MSASNEWIIGDDADNCNLCRDTTQRWSNAEITNCSSLSNRPFLPPCCADSRDKQNSLMCKSNVFDAFDFVANTWYGCGSSLAGAFLTRKLKVKENITVIRREFIITITWYFVMRIMKRCVSLMKKNLLIYASIKMHTGEQSRGREKHRVLRLTSSDHDNERELFLKGIHNVYRVYEFLRAIQERPASFSSAHPDVHVARAAVALSPSVSLVSPATFSRGGLFIRNSARVILERHRNYCCRSNRKTSSLSILRLGKQ